MRRMLFNKFALALVFLNGGSGLAAIPHQIGAYCLDPSAASSAGCPQCLVQAYYEVDGEANVGAVYPYLQLNKFSKTKDFGCEKEEDSKRKVTSMVCAGLHRRDQGLAYENHSTVVYAGNPKTRYEETHLYEIRYGNDRFDVDLTKRFQYSGDRSLPPSDEISKMRCQYLKKPWNLWASKTELMRARRPAIVCSGVEDCAEKNGVSASWDAGRDMAGGTWRLAGFTVDRKEIWRDERTHLLWGDKLGASNWAQALSECQMSSKSRQWHLPSAAQYLEAEANGLWEVLPDPESTNTAEEGVYWTGDITSGLAFYGRGESIAVRAFSSLPSNEPRHFMSRNQAAQSGVRCVSSD